MEFEKILSEINKFYRINKTKDIKFRIDSLKKLRESIIEYESEILDAIRLDLGKGEFEGYSSEIGFVIKELDYLISNLKNISKPQKVKTSLINFPGKSKLVNEPYGVALVIAPWNYPFQLTLGPLIGAVGAGNCCVVKPSEVSSNSAKVIEKIILSAFDENHVRVILGDSLVASKLLDLKFDYIFYTGSTQVGRIVMEKAAKNLTPVTLELGGKSPVIVDRTSNLKAASRRVVWGKFLNCGQTCIAPDYLYVHEDVKEEFLKLMFYEIENFYGNNTKSSSYYGKIINSRHFERLESYLPGNKILYGGDLDIEKLYFSPTIIEGNWNLKVMSEEIFGPILPVFSYTDEDEVISIINSKPKPLALYLFSKSSKTIDNFINNTSSGGVCINDTISHILGDLPFGGVGESGMGKYHGRWTFDTFSHKKGVLLKNPNVDPKFRYPPYKMSLKQIKRLFRFI